MHSGFYKVGPVQTSCLVQVGGEVAQPWGEKRRGNGSDLSVQPGSSHVVRAKGQTLDVLFTSTKAWSCVLASLSLHVAII